MREGTMRNAMTGATILLMMAASAAFGQEFPIYDVNSFCKGVDDICPTLEERARSDAEAKWIQLIPIARKYCIASNAKSRSYFSLAACVDKQIALVKNSHGQRRKNHQTHSD